MLSSKVNIQTGFRGLKMWALVTPMNKSHDTVHASWLQLSLPTAVIFSTSQLKRKKSRSRLKISTCVDHVTYDKLNNG